MLSRVFEAEKKRTKEPKKKQQQQQKKQQNKTKTNLQRVLVLNVVEISKNFLIFAGFKLEFEVNE